MAERADTICALASAPGRSGVAVIRVSGPDALRIAAGLCGKLPGSGEHGLRRLRRSDGTVLDDALVLAFHAPASFTGENTVEFQTHGSISVVDAVLKELVCLGARPAQAGEFTRRALENERLSLDQVEGLADLIDAETEAQRDMAQRLFSGRLRGLADDLRASVLRAAALIEATIDFADEDVPEDVTPEVLSLIGKVQAQLNDEIAGSRVAERIRDGFEVAIVGAPNSGKSTLLNAIAGRDAAIVSDVAGTTRDVLEVRLDLHGLPVTFLDTAGLRETTDRVERIGVARARDRAAMADLRIHLLQSKSETPELPVDEGDICVLGKADLTGGDVSGVTGQGVDGLLQDVFETLSAQAARAMTATNARHRYAMSAASDALTLAETELKSGTDRSDLAAEHVREAARRLDELVGRLDVEHLLDEIFSSFCIGK